MEDFEGPSFSLGFDFDFDDAPPKDPPVREEAPSFSLGLDLDSDFDTKNDDDSVFKQAPECSINVRSSQSFEKDESFQQETLIPDVYIDDPPPVLKRLKRGGIPPSSQSSAVKKKKKREPVVVSWNVDDDIEEFSSQEDSPKDKQSAVQNRSVWSSSKVPLHGHRVVITQSVSKQTTQKDTPSIASTISFEENKNCRMFPKLTISPLRKFQLVDSDSDDPSAIDVPRKDVNASGMKRQCYPSQSVSGIQQKKANISASTLKNVDLWKEFTPKKSVNIQTPALDEFCEEYFRSVKDTNVGKGKEDICPSSSKMCSQKEIIDEQYGNHPDPDSLPPAYRYFFHDDLRIQRLARDRLPNFFPLGAAGNQLDKQSDATAIDYMSQFGHKENFTQARGKTNKDLGQSSQRGRKNSKKPNAKEAAEGSQKKIIDEQYGDHPDPDSLPPAYRYFFHDDLRIQRLVRDRLPNFFPLAAAGNQLDKQSDATAIDYMSQFGHKENFTQARGKTNKDLGQSSQRGRKNSKKPNAKEAAEGSANWVSPKSCVNIPKDAGKRRVHANNQSSSGHWYSDHGKKVYMSKTGQVLTGSMAYRHYKKESGAGSRKSRKRTTSKKKPK